MLPENIDQSAAIASIKVHREIIRDLHPELIEPFNQFHQIIVAIAHKKQISGYNKFTTLAALTFMGQEFSDRAECYRVFISATNYEAIAAIRHLEAAKWAWSILDSETQKRILKLKESSNVIVRQR